MANKKKLHFFITLPGCRSGSLNADQWGNPNPKKLSRNRQCRRDTRFQLAPSHKNNFSVITHSLTLHVQCKYLMKNPLRITMFYEKYNTCRLCCAFETIIWRFCAGPQKIMNVVFTFTDFPHFLKIYQKMRAPDKVRFPGVSTSVESRLCHLLWGALVLIYNRRKFLNRLGCSLITPKRFHFRLRKDYTTGFGTILKEIPFHVDFFSFTLLTYRYEISTFNDSHRSALNLVGWIRIQEDKNYPQIQKKDKI